MSEPKDTHSTFSFAQISSLLYRLDLMPFINNWFYIDYCAECAMKVKIFVTSVKDFEIPRFCSARCKRRHYD